MPHMSSLLSVDHATDLAFRKLRGGHGAAGQLDGDAPKGLGVGQSRRLQLAVAAPDELLRRLAEVGDNLLDDAGGRSLRERRRAGEVPHQLLPFLAGHGGEPSPQIADTSNICPESGRYLNIDSP